MRTALYIPCTHTDLCVLQSNRFDVSEQYIHKSIKMAHQTDFHLYTSLYMYMVAVSKGFMMALRTIRDEDETDLTQTHSGCDK